jgi:ribonuclease P protein component
LGGAVRRNRIRRRLRAVVARRLGLMERPLDVVMHPRRSILNLEFSRLDAEIERLFSGLQKGKSR